MTPREQLGCFAEVSVPVQAELDQVRIPLAEILELRSGSLLRLKGKIGRTVRVRIGGTVFGTGELFATENGLAVRITGRR
jgi:flagellar motor switch/type III secretory pathway protein FliN